MLALRCCRDQAIREALRTAKWVWLATDCDREGQLIGQEILEHYEYRGQVMRVLFTAQDSQTIRDAFHRAKPNTEYAPLYAAAVARRQADRIYNLSLTPRMTVAVRAGSAESNRCWPREDADPWQSCASASWKSGTSCPSHILRLSPPRKLPDRSSRQSPASLAPLARIADR
jgi:hypothetical protein